MSNLLPVAGTAEVRRYARDLFRHYPRALSLAVGLHVVAAIAGLAGPRLLGDLVEAIQRQSGLATINRLSAAIAGFIVVQAVLVRFAVLASAQLGERVLARLREDFIDRVLAIWKECLGTYGGPFLFGKQPCMADAMYAPVVTRFLSYDVTLDRECAAYCKRVMELPAMQEWVAAAKQEPDEIDELDAEF